MSIYKEEMDLLEKLIKLEGVPITPIKPIAFLMYLTAMYEQNDAYAGMILKDFLRKHGHMLKGFVKSVLEVEFPVNEVTMGEVLDVLARRHKVFKALREKYPKRALYELEKKLDKGT